MRLRLLFICFLALIGCDAGGDCPGPSGAGPDTMNADSLSQDLQDDQILSDVESPQDTGPGGDTSLDSGAENSPPSFGPLPAVDLDMGTSTTLGLAELMDDAEDPDGALALTWSADHVALQDGPSHALLVVAPVDWWGIETIPIILTDTAGLEAAADLVVTVNEVIPPVTPPPETCGEVTFSYTDPGALLVELAGSFNATWDPEAMEDGDGDGTWELVKVLTPGAWEYKFVVDGAWGTDPTNPNKVSDGLGGHNSLLEVTPCPED